jgi:methylmalonyl-CoA epimerase
MSSLDPGVRLAHLGVIVHRVDAAAAFYGRLGLPEQARETFPEENVRMVFVKAAGVQIELLEPLRPAGPLSRFLTGRGEGIHHLALEVPDIDRALARARAAGIRLIDGTPRRGAHGTRVAFLHPDALHGVLIELVEVERGQSSQDPPR